jgi:hypothetical protein
VNDLKFTTAGDYMEPDYEPDDGPLTDDQLNQIRKLNMNDKIRNLLRESRLDVYGLATDYTKWDDAVKRFTDLLVDDICDDMMSLEPMYPANIVALKIRQKYNVGAKVNLGSLDQYDDPAWQGKTR